MSESVIGRLPVSRNALVFAGLTAFLVLAAWPTFSRLYGFALHDATFSHMLLTPFLGVFFFWRSREAIQSAARPAAGAGIGLMVAGLGGYLALRFLRPELSGNNLMSAQMATLWSAWIGAFFVSFGLRSAASALFPLGIMLFLIPFPDFALDGIVETLRHGSALAVSGLFGLLGVSHIREGATVFHLSSVSIDIAPQCSGIRSSIALALTALMAGQLFLTGFWRKLVLVVVAGALMMLKNGIRIVTLTLLAEHVDMAWLTHSKLHSRGGIVFFGIAVIMLLGVMVLLQRAGKPAKPTQQPQNA